MTVPDSVPYDTDIAGAAALIADPSRAVILRALISGRPLAAGELARLAGLGSACSTPCSHHNHWSERIVVTAPALASK